MEHAGTLTGHFFTRDEAAAITHSDASVLAQRPGALPLAGRCSYEEVYPAFAFDDDGLRPEVETVVERLRADMSAWDAASWLLSPNPALGGTTPLQRLGEAGPGPVLGIL